MTCTALALLMCGVQSCIWEDREQCPSFLSLDFSGTPEEVERIYLVLTHQDGWTCRDTLLREDFGKGYEIAVKRGPVHLAAFGNISRMTYDSGYTVRTGDQADSIYTCFLRTDCSTDLANDTVRMHKDFIGLHIRVLEDVLGSDSIYLSITSSSIGYGTGGEIIEGKFRHIPQEVPDTRNGSGYRQYISRVTRQRDSSLTLSINTVDGDHNGPVTVIGLARSLEEAGIDMEAEDLGDLYLTVDFAKSVIKVSPQDWNNINNTIEIEL